MRLPYLVSSLLLIAFVFWGVPHIVSGAAPKYQELFAQLDTNSDGYLQAEEIDAKNARLFTRLLRTVDDNSDGQLSADEFERGLQSQRLDKPLPKKQGNKLPGGDALLWLLASMDTDGNRTITASEVPAEFQGFFNQVQARIGGKPDGRITQREIAQSAPRLSQMALRYATQREIDVEVEIALLPKKQWSMLERMDTPFRSGNMLSNPAQAEEMFSRLDEDGNGQVTVEEVPPPIVERFEQLLKGGDKNRDGQLSKEELLALSRRIESQEMQQLPQAEIDRRLKRLFRRFDQNGDNRLSLKEAPRRMKDRFEHLDADDNGSLDRQELTRVVELLNQLRKPEGKGAVRTRARKK